MTTPHAHLDHGLHAHIELVVKSGLIQMSKRGSKREASRDIGSEASKRVAQANDLAICVRQAVGQLVDLGLDDGHVALDVRRREVALQGRAAHLVQRVGFRGVRAGKHAEEPHVEPVRLRGLR